MSLLLKKTSDEKGTGGINTVSIKDIDGWTYIVLNEYTSFWVPPIGCPPGTYPPKTNDEKTVDG